MNASAWTRIKRGKALSSGVGLIQPNTSGDVLMERRFVNGPILFNGKVVSECCDPASATSAEVGTIVLQFSPFTAFSALGNTLSFLALNGSGTVDFGNGVILPISGVVTGQIYPVGSTVTIRSSDIILINIWGLNTQGLTSIVCNQGLSMLNTFGIDGSNTLSSLDIAAVGSSLVYLECVDCSGITSIIGLNACKSLRALSVAKCSLSGSLDIRPFAATLTNLTCGDQPITEIVGLNMCKNLAVLDCGFCALSELDIRPFAATLTSLNCAFQPLTEIVGLDTCDKLTSLICFNCALSGPLDIRSFAATLTILNIANNSINEIVGLDLCRLEYLICYACDLSGQFNITSSAETLLSLACSNQDITEIVGLDACNVLESISCGGSANSISGTLDITVIAGSIVSVSCRDTLGLTDVNVSGCSRLNYLGCDECSILQDEANAIVSALVANGLTGGTLTILNQQTGTLNSSGWTALGDATGSTGLGWFIS